VGPGGGRERLFDSFTRKGIVFNEFTGADAVLSVYLPENGCTLDIPDILCQ